MRTLAEHWGKFEGEAISSDADATQRLAMRAAFYAGIASLFQLMDTQIGPDEVSNEEGERRLRALADELESELAEITQQMVSRMTGRRAS